MKATNIIVAIFSTVIKIALTVIVVLFIYNGAMIGYEFGYRVFKQQPMALGTGRSVTVSIPEDVTVKGMSELFLEKGLIDNKLLFTAQYYLSEFREELRPGVYELSTAMTVEEMMEVMGTHPEEEESEDK